MDSLRIPFFSVPGGDQRIKGGEGGRDRDVGAVSLGEGGKRGC